MNERDFSRWLNETRMIINRRAWNPRMFRSHGRVGFKPARLWYIVYVDSRGQKEVIAFVNRLSGDVHLPMTPTKPDPSPVWNVAGPGWNDEAKGVGFK